MKKLKVLLGKITSYFKLKIIALKYKFLGYRKPFINESINQIPYQITVKNPTNKTLKFILFGKNLFLLTKNFGSDVELDVKPSQLNVPYILLLNESAEQPFETSLIRVQSTNAAQVTQILSVQSTDADGKNCTAPIITRSYFNVNQFQSGIVDIPINIKINGNTYISGEIFPNTTVVYTFNKKNKETLKQKLTRKLNIFFSIFLKFLIFVFLILSCLMIIKLLK